MSPLGRSADWQEIPSALMPYTEADGQLFADLNP
jgi:hypothetical protein